LKDEEFENSIQKDEFKSKSKYGFKPKSNEKSSGECKKLVQILRMMLL
jgi:hypothetical protein